MSNGVSLSIEGWQELDKRLKALDEEVSKRLAIRAIRVGTRLMFNEVKSAAPVGPGTPKLRRTKNGDIVVGDYGHLRDNIRMRQPDKRSRVAAQAGGLFEFIITTGAAFWGRFLEEGTVKMSARPWMRPTFDGNVDAVTERVGHELKVGIDKFVAKNGG